MKKWIWIVAGCAAVWGCGPTVEPKQTPPPTEAEGAAEANSAKPATKPAPSPDKPGTPTGVGKNPGAVPTTSTTPISSIPVVKIPEESVRIKQPNQGTWVASDTPPGELGERMDTALSALGTALVDGRITIDSAKGVLVAKPQLKIGAKGKYSLDYQLPGTDAAPKRLRSDGIRAAELSKEGWKDLVAEGGTLTEAQLEAWPRQFPRLMLTNISEKKVVWQPLLSHWQKAPYKTYVEARTNFMGGKNRTLYRVVTEKPLEGGTVTMEVIMDGSSNLPVTVRTEIVKPNTKKERIMWTGRWGFGGKFEDKEFELPEKE